MLPSTPVPSNVPPLLWPNSPNPPQNRAGILEFPDPFPPQPNRPQDKKPGRPS